MGGGGGGYDVNQMTDDQKTHAQLAAKAYNEMVAGRPFEDAYIKDITADPGARTSALQGQVNADVMQKAGPARIDPNRSVTGQTTPAPGIMAKAQTATATDAKLQRLAGMTGLIQSATGQAGNVMTGMEGMAKDATSRSIADAESNYQTSAAMRGSLATGMGALAGVSSIASGFNKK